MAEEGEDDIIAPNDALDMISEDEATANTGNENVRTQPHFKRCNSVVCQVKSR
jgi:hypothetical protein